MKREKQRVLNFTPQEDLNIRFAAEAAGVTVSAWMRHHLQRAAQSGIVNVMDGFAARRLRAAFGRSEIARVFHDLGLDGLIDDSYFNDAAYERKNQYGESTTTPRVAE